MNNTLETMRRQHPYVPTPGFAPDPKFPPAPMKTYRLTPEELAAPMGGGGLNALELAVKIIATIAAATAPRRA